MTTIENNLTVDGTVTASQATQAGEAVVLGSDGTVPSSLLPSSGGDSTPIYYISLNPSAYVFTEACTSGSTDSSYAILYAGLRGGEGKILDKCFESIIPGGIIKFPSSTVITPTSGSSEYSFGYAPSSEMSAFFTHQIRTNLRGNFKIRGFLTTSRDKVKVDYNAFYLNTGVEYDVTITDNGVTWNSGAGIIYGTTTPSYARLTIRDVVPSTFPEEWI